MKFNKEKAEHEYITTNISYRELAKKHEVSRQTIESLGKKEEWTKKRKDYRARLSQNLVEKSMEEDVDKLSNLKTMTDTVIEVAKKRVQEYIENEDMKLDAQEIKQYASAIKDLVAIQRDLHGIVNEEKNKRQIIVELQGEMDKWSQ